MADVIRTAGRFLLDHGINDGVLVGTARERGFGTGARGESLALAFERPGAPGDLNGHELVEAVTCLADSKGGTLLTGVEDHGKTTEPSRLEALIQYRTRPPLPTAVEVVTVDGLDVVVARIPEAQLPEGTNWGMYQRRALRMDAVPECVAYEPHALMMSSFSASGLR